MQPGSFLGWIIPLLLGFAAVAQGGLNRNVSERMGLPGALVANSSVVLVCSLLVYAFSLRYPGWLPESLRTGTEGNLRLTWSALFAGLLGCFFVLGLPLSIFETGALKTFVLLMVSQTLFSAIWDYGANGAIPSPSRLVGATLALVGAVIASRG